MKNDLESFLFDNLQISNITNFSPDIPIVAQEWSGRYSHIMFHDFQGAINQECGNGGYGCVFAYRFRSNSDFVLVNEDTISLFTPTQQKIIKSHINSDRASILCYDLNSFGDGVIGFAIENKNRGQHGTYDYVVCNPLNYLVRDYDSDYDWQHNPYDSQMLQQSHPYLHEFISQMKRYKTTNTHFHSGDLYEHSVWCLLYAEDLMEIIDPDYFSTLSDSEKKIIAVCAFLHDIGKMVIPEKIPGKSVYRTNDGEVRYDSLDLHPLYGAEHIDISNEKTYTATTSNLMNGINIREIIESFDVHFTPYHASILKECILNHWSFGDVFFIKKQSSEEYIETLNLDTFSSQREKMMYTYAVLCTSVADIFSTQPYSPDVLDTDRTKFMNANGNVFSKYFNFVSNVSKNYSGKKFDNIIGQSINYARDVFEKISG
jgi:HD-GYP domain-containing protein (c-di-GMP phosphodiesterase class II)